MNGQMLASVVIFLLLVHSKLYAKPSNYQPYEKPCNYEFFCDSEFLYAIGKSRAFKDSKTIVDLVMKTDFSLFKDKFREELYAYGVLDNATKVREIVYKYFYPAGGELEQVEPSDWIEDPFGDTIKDPNYRRFALDLNNIWKKLARKAANDSDTGRRSSFLKMPYESIVPGGRFREIYYWDSYWTIQGLLACKMYQTVKTMLQNMLYNVHVYGFVPNGGRVYYLARSQPPFLTLMMKEYIDETGDLEFLRDSLPLLDKEYRFWGENRAITVHNKYRLYQYRTRMAYERPESCYEDNQTASLAMEIMGRAKEQVYIDLSSAAESGWDFSSRWLAYSGPDSLELYSIRTTELVPVCLNAILYKVTKQLEKFHGMTGNRTAEECYRKEAELLQEAITAVLWDPSDNIWFDYDLGVKAHHHEMYMSNYFPLWAGCHNLTNTSINAMLAHLRASEFLNLMGGFPTSSVFSTEQWDFPNAWAPLEEIFIEGLMPQGKTGEDMAMQLMHKWIDNNYYTYYSGQERNMYEKYSSTRRGYPGEGGEYDVQIGFGWSNGVALKYLRKYGQILVSSGLKASPDKPA